VLDTLLILITVVALLVSLPGSLYLLVLTSAGIFNRLRPRVNPVQDTMAPIKFAVIVPAHNESNNVLVAINSLNACTSPQGGYEVVIVADNCSNDDDTADIARAAGCRVVERSNDDERGKGYALDYAFNLLADEDHDAFLILDADTHCEPNLMVEFEKHLANGEHVLQAPYLVDNANSGMYAQVVGIGFRAFNYLRPSGRARLGFSAGILGTGFTLSKHVIKEVPYTAASIVEDLEYHLNLVRSGYKCCFVEQTCVYSAMPESSGGSETQRSRWEGGRIRMMADNCLPLVKEIASGRWRLIEPLLELLLLPLWMHVSMLLVLLISPLWICQVYGLMALVLIVVHVIAAVLSTGGGWAELKVLLYVPRYILWKFKIVGKIFGKASKGAGWDRTGRD
jgi:cellulose synthase/poly-beta-1,6-N-acetylglucosamine synthase-like glycosyltransferase